MFSNVSFAQAAAYDTGDWGVREQRKAALDRQVRRPPLPWRVAQWRVAHTRFTKTGGDSIADATVVPLLLTWCRQPVGLLAAAFDQGPVVLCFGVSGSKRWQACGALATRPARMEQDAEMLTQGGQGGRPAPLAPRLHSIPTHFPLICMGSAGRCLRLAPLADRELSPQARRRALLGLRGPLDGDAPRGRQGRAPVVGPRQQ